MADLPPPPFGSGSNSGDDEKEDHTVGTITKVANSTPKMNQNSSFSLHADTQTPQDQQPQDNDTLENWFIKKEAQLAKEYHRLLQEKRQAGLTTARTLSYGSLPHPCTQPLITNDNSPLLNHARAK
ncbi:hypothetical protein HanIR_Chr08g0354781 [Helianthus annuus]|nr:hypothetical protein HanIR_Chr08g0354781 [Helianthus annuus]